MWAALSFVVILIILGVPLWWKMTEVERSFFPYSEIAELHSRNIIFPLHIDVKTSSISAENLVNDLENLFIQSSKDNLNEKLVLKTTSALLHIFQKLLHNILVNLN